MQTSATPARLQNLYSNSEELANRMTHAFGVVLSVIGLSILLEHAIKLDDIWHVLSVSLYGMAMIVLFSSSTIYHWVTSEQWKRRFQLMDHCSIYLMIAGSYTPFVLVALRGTLGWALFGIVWTLAITGIVLKLVFTGRFHKVSLANYLLMGWLVVGVSSELLSAISVQGMLWLAMGGLFYTVGVVFYLWKALPFNHAIWHLFVLAGAASIFLSVWWYVLPLGVTY